MATPHPSSAPLGAFRSGPLVLEHAALLTDLYELTMAASYRREGMGGTATFSLFVRRLPPGRAYLIAAGLEEVLHYLERFCFSDEALGYLRSLERFEPTFLEYLRGLRFTGSVRAMPEGTPIFGDEPLLEVTAPIAEAQLVESAVLNFCHLQTLLASKAARCVVAARGRPVVEFGLRRAHGVDAALKAVRCSYLAGAEQTSDVLGGWTYGVPPTGTMAHSYVCAFPHEIDAFRAFARAFPGRAILLIDTFDTVAAAHKAVRVARELAERGDRLAGVRLDSGDLVTLSRAVRGILDASGLNEVKIFASGNLDEDAIDKCLAAGAPVDAFGVGTRMNVSADAPYLDMAYKLVRYEARDILKTSPGKETWAGEKQVYRQRGNDGRARRDLLALRDEPAPTDGEPLLEIVMERGRPTGALPSLEALRARCATALAALPDPVLRGKDAAYPVQPSPALIERQRALKARVSADEVTGHGP
jgi:nicotinate phosphoribosyltransferase